MDDAHLYRGPTYSGHGIEDCVEQNSNRPGYGGGVRNADEGGVLDSQQQAEPLQRHKHLTERM